MGNPLWIRKLSESIERYLGREIMSEIMAGGGKFEALDEEARALWVKKAMDRLDARVADEDIKIKIMTECSCQCYQEHIEEFKKEYRKHRDIDNLLEIMHGKVFLIKPVKDGDIVYVTKAPRFPEEYRKAKTFEEKKYFFCHCDHARAAKGRISPTYCLCGAGWCKKIWEGALERPIKVDILRSVLRGDDICRFAVHL
jgi:hypothetical protein